MIAISWAATNPKQAKSNNQRGKIMEFENGDKGILDKMVAPLVGKKAWGVKKGYGSFLTIEFGTPLRDQIINVEFGEWHLWAYFCHWKINKNDKFIVGSESPEKKLQTWSRR